jgi:minor extracellular serine protease Vpr
MGGFATRSRVAALAAVCAIATTCSQSPALAASRVEVVVSLSAPSLVTFAQGQRTLQGYGHGHRVLASAFGSRMYLARLRGEQALATQRIERAIPGSRVRRHYLTVLDGLSVLLSPTEVRALRRVRGVTAVYPNLRYHELTDTVPEVIGAPGLWGTDLAGGGEGIKIGVIDDGIDQRHPFFASSGLVAPPGYPKGVRAFTTGKVIVARSFAPAGAPRRDRLPFDSAVSHHGTHVAGILAGDQGLVAPGDSERPTVTGLSGVAPRAWLGNYRGLAIPDPTYGSIGSTADLVAAVDAAVADGMDVINLSFGGTEIDPNADALVGAVQGAVAAGVVVVAAAGNERAFLGYGSIESPAAASGAIAVAATTSTRFFGRRSSITGPGVVPVALRAFGVAAPGTRGDPPHAFSGSLAAAAGGGDGRLCKRFSGSELEGSIALAARGGCSVTVKARVAKDAGATAVLVPPVDTGPPESEYGEMRVPVFVAPQPVVDGLAAYLATGASARLQVGAATGEEPTAPGVVASFSSGGPTPFDQLLKPDIAAPGVNILSSVPDSSTNEPGDWEILDGTSMSSPVVAGAAALLLQAHPDWTPADVKEALMATAHPAFVDEAGTREASPLTVGAGFVDVAAANAPGVVGEPPSLDFGAIRDGATATLQLVVRDLGGGAGSWTVAARTIGNAPPGVIVSTPPVVSVPVGGSATVAVEAAVAAGVPEKEASGVIELVQGARTRRVPFWLRVENPQLATKKVRTLVASRTLPGNTLGAGNRAISYGYPTDASAIGLPRRFFGPEQLWHFRIGAGEANAGVSIETDPGVVAYPILLTGRDEHRVAGESGLPLNVGPLPSSGNTVPAAGLDFPAPGDYWVAVESPIGKAGRYRIRLWVGDQTPPRISVLGQSIEQDHRVLRLRIVDSGSGVDPGGVTVSGGGIGRRSADFDAATGIATVDLQHLQPGRHALRIQAPDLAETKDVLTVTARASNTATRIVHITVPR